MRFRSWLLSERTLYHGTVVDNEESIRKYGLQGGWHGPIGSFVSQHYSDDDYGPPSEDDETIFLTDKQELGKAINGMVHHIGQKLGKSFHDVTDNDIRNHGLLVIVRDEENSIPQADDESGRIQYPRGTERNDYYTQSAGADAILKGAVLLRFLRQHGEWPRVWGKNNQENLLRGELVRLAISKHPGKTKQQIIQKVMSLDIDQVRTWVQQWRG